MHSSEARVGAAAASELNVVMNTIAFILIGVGVLFSLLNWLFLFGSWFSKRYMSPALPAPSILTALGLALHDQTRPYWWLGLLTDYTLVALVIAIPRLAVEVWRTSRFTRLKLLIAEDPPRRFQLSLHRGGHFLLQAKFEPPLLHNAHGARIVAFGAAGRWQDVTDGQFRLWGYREDRVLTLVRTAADYVAREDHYPADVEYQYDALDGLVFRRPG
jgi:hypothetical protein